MITKIVSLSLCIFLSIFCSCVVSPKTSEVSHKTSGVSPQTTATISNIYVESDPPYGSNDYYHTIPAFTIDVVLKPGSLAKANAGYLVALYENGNFRSNSDTEISWTQGQLNLSEDRTVKFTCTEQEYLAYLGKDISSVFIVELTLSTSNPISTT